MEIRIQTQTPPQGTTLSLPLVFIYTKTCAQACIPHSTTDSAWGHHRKQDLAAILSSPELLNALTHSPTAGHPSLAQSHATLQAALTENQTLARHLLDLEAHLASQRAGTQAQLLSTHALERQWRAKQAEMDEALAPFAPASLYARLTAGLAEQAAVCAALEESFLDSSGGGGGGDDAAHGDGVASEREVLDWVRRYRDNRKLFYLRQERKERWNERRVGGWR